MKIIFRFKDNTNVEVDNWENYHRNMETEEKDFLDAMAVIQRENKNLTFNNTSNGETVIRKGQELASIELVF